MNPDEMRRMTGVDRLPGVSDPAALTASVARHYPAELREQRVSGSALIDVTVDAAGRVDAVTPVQRPAGVSAALILEDRDGTRRRLEPRDHPAFQAAAVAALREVSFSPARRDGEPVPFTPRMTIFFDPPAAEG